jgi:pimeloyl-ACP methyl ester carboxylesterase
MPRGQLLKSWYMLAFQLPALPERLLFSGAGGRLLSDGAMPVEQARRYITELGPDGLTAALNWYRALPLGGRGHGFARPVTVPTLYVWSDRDKYLGRAAAEATERYVRAPYQFEVLGGISHWIPEQAPDRFGAVLLEHLAANG